MVYDGLQHSGCWLLFLLAVICGRSGRTANSAGRPYASNIDIGLYVKLVNLLK